jgi:hypothetical protein
MPGRTTSPAMNPKGEARHACVAFRMMCRKSQSKSRQTWAQSLRRGLLWKRISYPLWPPNQLISMSFSERVARVSHPGMTQKSISGPATTGGFRANPPAGALATGAPVPIAYCVPAGLGCNHVATADCVGVFPTTRATGIDVHDGRYVGILSDNIGGQDGGF